MTEAQRIEPDMGFVKQLMELGGESLKKCYQCATCSVVCTSSPDAWPFPRKEMIWAQWGLKDRLVKDPDIWLCHQCNDCSVRCPRGAKPGDVLAAARSYSIRHYAFPGFLGKVVSQARYLPFLVAIPALLLLITLSLTGRLAPPAGTIVFEAFIPHRYIDLGFVALGLFALGAMAVGVGRFWRGLQESPARPGSTPSGSTTPDTPVRHTNPGAAGPMDWKQGLLSALSEILRHRRFQECQANGLRYYAHLAIFYGFLGLFLTTTLVFLGIVLGGIRPPLSPFSPVKLLGNLSGLALLGGLTVVFYQRIAQPEQTGHSAYPDWFFLGSLYATALTGVLTEATRMAGLALAYPLYAIHLIAIFVLLACLPYSRFAHLFYRAAAMVHANRSGRES